ncbi:Uma2 family endonuclease [Megamonas hypermegale]|uniref:Uma2 family endonuclease n=1 Tax=Megamonas hypermegale TaxID=158847 RepID=UPI0026ECCFD3|nr:Uma2 family endonuclease [Megamonas hypermegale]
MNNLAKNSDDFTRLEMINGKIVMMSPRPAPFHTLVSGKIYSRLENFLKGKPCIAFPDGVAVYFDDKNYFVPDCMIVCDKKKIQNDGIHGAPDLVVEVLSQGTARFDRGYKKDVYEASGVKEYWIVDINSKSIEVYLNRDGRFFLDYVYEYHTDDEIAYNKSLPDNDPRKIETIDTEITVSIFDNCRFQLKEIFEIGI